MAPPNLSRSAGQTEIFAAAFARSAVGMAIVAPDGHWLQVNDALCAIVGFPREELETLTFQDITFPDDLAADLQFLEQTLAGITDSFVREKRYIRKDGSTVWIHLTVTLVRRDDRKPDFFICLIQDIQRRKLMEANQTWLASIVESSDDAIISKTLDGVITSWNHGAERLFTHTAAEAIGKPIGMIIPPALADEERTIIDRVRLGESVTQVETRRLRKDGREIDVSVTVSPIRDAFGQVVGAVKVARDITDRKRAEKELRQAKDAAEAAVRAKSQFLANMSHEIRTPMNAVLGLTQLALDDNPPPAQRDALRKIKSSAASLLSIINDILDFSKIEAGRLSLERVEFPVEQTLRQTASLFLEPVTEKGLELFIDIAPDVPPTLVGDPLRLGQVLSNLLGNAVKFTEKGEIHLRAEIAQQEGDTVVLRFAVRDTGIGLSKEHADRLFEPFVQADGSITRRYGGTGLGLTISRRLVELMNGKFALSSSPGEGSNFAFTASFGIPRQRAVVRHYLDGLRVLVVDDQETSLAILRQLLESWQARVTTLTGGRHVLASLDHAEQDGAPFELLLLDWQMPDVDGLAVARLIEEAVAGGHLRRPPTVIMVTAHDKARLLAAAEPTKFDGVLVKPVTSSGLFDTIAQLRNPSLHVPTKPVPDDTTPYAMARDIKGASILLVEDNLLNQEVAVGFLERADLKVTVAGNGRAAVDLVGATRFDAILMDLQMPEMDGIEATRLIRRLPNGAAIPIIAMTAAAMREDRLAAAEAGMNDHVSKPFVAPELLAVLLKWIKPTMVKADDETPPADVDEAVFPVIPGIDRRDAVMRMGGSLAVFRRVLTRTIADFADFIEQVRMDVAAGRGEEASRRLHTFRGVAGNISAFEAMILSGDAESAVRDRRWDVATDLVNRLARVLDRLFADIRSYLAQPAPADDGQIATPAGDLDPVAFDTLLAALAANKMAAVDIFADLRPALFKEFGAAITDQAGLAVECLRFDEAIALLRRRRRR